MPEAGSDPSLDAIRASKRKWAAKKRAELESLTRLEQLAYRLRGSLGEGFDPYTPSEREKAEEIRQRLEDIQKDADMLHQEMMARLSRSDQQGLRQLGSLLAVEKASRVDLKSY